MIIAIDFPGIIVDMDYPEIGDPVPLALETLKYLTFLNHKLILSYNIIDSNDVDRLNKAIEYLKHYKIDLYDVNKNKQFQNIDNRNVYSKIYANMYISIFNFGCPKIKNEFGINVFDWSTFIKETDLFSDRIKKRLLRKRCERCNELLEGIDLECYNCKGILNDMT